MSCWCDGEDPGCETCHPSMHPDTRVAVRLVRTTHAQLCEAAISGDGATLLIAAAAYRSAVELNRLYDYAKGRKS